MSDPVTLTYRFEPLLAMSVKNGLKTRGDFFFGPPSEFINIHDFLQTATNFFNADPQSQNLFATSQLRFPGQEELEVIPNDQKQALAEEFR